MLEAEAPPRPDGEVVAEDTFPSADWAGFAFPFPFAAGVLSRLLLDAFLDTTDAASDLSTAFRLGGILMSAPQRKDSLPQAVKVIAFRSTSGARVAAVCAGALADASDESERQNLF